MITGKRIKRIRNLRGMTQKELGSKAGFTNENCDARIGQYESGARTPKQNIRNRLAEALKVGVAAISEPSVDSDIDVMHALFMLDDIYNLRILKTDIGDLCIMVTPNNATLYENMADWEYIQREYDKGAMTRDEYEDWKYNYNIVYSKEDL